MSNLTLDDHISLAKPLAVAQSLERLAMLYQPQNDGDIFEVSSVLHNEVGERMRKSAAKDADGGIFGERTDSVITEVLDEAETLVARHANWVYNLDLDDFETSRHDDCETDDEGDCVDGDDCDPDPYGYEWGRWYAAKKREAHEDLVKVANKAYRANDKAVRDFNKSRTDVKIKNYYRGRKVAVAV